MAELNDSPMLRSFRILGLHGYKNVLLDFIGPARIVIAENGMGKTTILSALHAFLTKNFFKLQSLSFESIECQFTSSEDPLVLHKEDLPHLLDSVAEERLRELSQFTDIDTSELLDRIIEEDFDHSSDISTHPVLRQVYIESPYSAEQIHEYVLMIKSTIEQTRSEKLQQLVAAITSLTRSYEILYLPTYRRIEIPIQRTPRRQFRRRPSRFAEADDKRRRELMDLDIQFGLSDVSDRLTHLFETIQRQSNFGYRSISANIIDDLLAGLLRDNHSEPTAGMPDIDALARFFSRIDNRESPDDRLQSLRSLYESSEIATNEHTTLRYFLTKLSAVVETTKGLEADIEAFVGKANGYLKMSSDEKILEYDPNEMKVIVRNPWTAQEVDLNDLSSGEKQVISLLAKLYLYPEQKKIVLIDEPELSLSIDWQKCLLPDLLFSPSCVQLLAITHSPFIFDNELDPCAGPISIQRASVARENNDGE